MVRAGGANVDLLPDQAVRNRVEEAVDLDVIIERDAGEAPLGELIVVIRQRRQDGRSTVSNSWRRLTPSRRMTCSLMRSSAAAIAAFASASEKKVCRRSRPRI